MTIHLLQVAFRSKIKVFLTTNSMTYTIREEWNCTITTATSTINMLIDRWNSFAAKEADAIRELQNLEPGARTTELELLRARILNDLPDVTPSNIIDDGLMNNSSEPYRNYIANESNIWITKAIENTLHTNKDKYVTMLNELLKDRQKQAHLGKYLFESRTFDITATPADGNAANVHLSIDLEAKVIIDADSRKANIDNDTVGLTDIGNDIKDTYLTRIKPELEKDLRQYYDAEASNFNNNALGAALRDMQGILH
jgi:hypothetical protein